ncbi:uncharacterized protein V1518DRAFT_412538 [Limtongia smithiae]|uniref:uncharacterized protein n=1 Tax=Limtongia smithiae TaxID=1125753 RepID=UPI0034CF4F86
MVLSIEDLPAEVLQCVAAELADRDLCSFLTTCRSIHATLAQNRYSWRARFLSVFDAPVFFTRERGEEEEEEQERVLTDQKAIKEREVLYDFGESYKQRRRVLARSSVDSEDLDTIVSMIAEHSGRNCYLIEKSALPHEFVQQTPRAGENAAGPNQDKFLKLHLIKSIIVPGMGFPGIPASPLDPIYRIVYDSPRHPLFHPVTRMPQLYVVAALVTFWQMMNVQSGLRKFRRGWDPIETLGQGGRRSAVGAVPPLATLERETTTEAMADDSSVCWLGDSGQSSSGRWMPETEEEEKGDNSMGDDTSNVFLGAYAFFNYWDFELFRSAPLSSEARRSIIGDIVDWHLDVPEHFSGPICLWSTGTSHQLTGVTEQRRSIVEIRPIETPIMGVRGWAEFYMRRLEFEVEQDYFEEQRWIHQAVMLPGSKAVVGRWRDGFDEDTERAVEGPVIWIRQ